MNSEAGISTWPGANGGGEGGVDGKGETCGQKGGSGGGGGGGDGGDGRRGGDCGSGTALHSLPSSTVPAPQFATHSPLSFFDVPAPQVHMDGAYGGGGADGGGGGDEASEHQSVLAHRSQCASDSLHQPWITLF